MELKQIIAAMSAVVATGAFAGGGQYHSQSSEVWVPVERIVVIETDSPLMVQRVQEELIATGYDPGPANGQFTAQTQESLSEFQASEHLSQTGQIDAPTLVALGIVSDESPGNSSQRNGSPDISSRGYSSGRSPGPLAVPGQYAPDSSSSAGMSTATNSSSSRPWGSHAPRD